MSQIKRIIEDFNIHTLIEQRNKEYATRSNQEEISWGERGEILNIGKPMSELNFHRGKTIVSSRKQVQLLYDWFLNCEDRRTRVIGKAWFKKEPGFADDLKQGDLFKDWFTEEELNNPIDTEFVYKQKFFTYQKILKIMKQITENRESQYILTNPVYALPHEIKYNYGKRTLDRLTELHVLYAELDHYKLKQWEGKTSKQMWRIVKKHLVENDFPLPTEVVFSRGLQMYWKHAPIPAFMVDEWRMMMHYVNRLLIDFGADTHALDPVRILRAVGSLHEKTGEKITGTSFTNDRYDFMEIFNTYCAKEWEAHLLAQEKERQKRVKALEERWYEKQKWMFENKIIDENGDFTEKYDPNKKQKKKRINAAAKNHRYNSRHENIIHGVFWLSDHVRKGNMDGHREFSCYLVRAMALRVTGGNNIEALRLMEELYSGFTVKRYTWADMLERTKSAELDYKRWAKNETQGIRYKTSTLIEKFKITPDEMKKMRFIVDEERSAELKAEYDRMYQKQKRKAKGIVSNVEKREKVLAYFKENPEASNAQASKDLKISRPTIVKYRNELGV